MKGLHAALGLALAASLATAPSASLSLPRFAPPSVNPGPLVQPAGGWWHPWRTVEGEVASGVSTRVRAYIFKCTVGGDGTPTIAATASHGTVALKTGSTKACGKTVPTTEVWYQSEVGFHGVDEVMVGAPVYESVKLTVR